MHADAESEYTVKHPKVTLNRPKLELEKRLPRYFAEMVIGLVLAALIALALVATVGSVPFIYQGF
jgi:hypothetical protein